MVRVELSRDEFISKVANWLPEWKNFSLGVLRLESLGRIKLVRDDGIAKAIWTANGKEFLRFCDG